MEVPSSPPASDRPAPAGAAPAAGRGDQSHTVSLKVLFVDDEPDLAPLIRQTFRRHVREGRYVLDFAGDGVEALERLDADPDIEIVVTDINMPRMDGLTLLTHLRERERNHKAIVVTAYGDMENIRTAMNQGAFDFLTKPIDLTDLETTIANARTLVEREREAMVVRQMFGRYLSAEVASAVLSNPGVLQGERREVSVLMSDLAGFSAIAERLEPEGVVELLNVYLGRMTDLVERYGGTVDEFIGDAVLAIFGAPVLREDHAARAVACGIAMQREMGDVNNELARRGLPSLEMVAAINTGDVVVGSIGSERRAKYGVVGSPVNLASRIQTLAAPGEVVITDTTRRAAGDALRIAESREVALKGFADPISVHFVAGARGVGGVDSEDLALPAAAEPLVELREAVPVVYAVLDGKQVTGDLCDGRLAALSPTRAVLHSASDIEPRADLRVSVTLPGSSPAGAGVSGDLYAKVVAVSSAPEGGSAATLRLTSVPEALGEALRAVVS
jgi:class 3 adenylate cyclase